jgi:hypothetical protein
LNIVPNYTPAHTKRSHMILTTEEEETTEGEVVTTTVRVEITIAAEETRTVEAEEIGRTAEVATKRIELTTGKILTNTKLPRDMMLQRIPIIIMME